MVKSLEQYLSDLPFANPADKNIDRTLTSAERSFVEKYMGIDALEAMPRLEPEARDIFLKPAAPRLKLAEPEIRVARPEIVVAAPEKEQPASTASASLSPQANVPQKQAETSAKITEKPVVAVQTQTFRKTVPQIVVATEPEKQPEKKPVAEPVRTPVQIEVAEPAETQQVLRDSIREQEAVQVVSFFVAGQLFLLPVAGIQEVLRRMELVRVPQAPDFIAGAINLRGKVTPLVHLSALLTNETNHVYDADKNFIIICGTDKMQIGLIIDKINSMHVVPQNKFIWNAEAKLGEAAEFLFAIADLDDRVCGVVAPDSIIKKIAQA